MDTLYLWQWLLLSDYLLRTGQRRIRLDESLPVQGNTGTNQRLLATVCPKTHVCTNIVSTLGKSDKILWPYNSPFHITFNLKLAANDYWHSVTKF